MQIGASLQNVKFGGRNGKVAAGGYSSRCPRLHSTLRVYNLIQLQTKNQDYLTLHSCRDAYVKSVEEQENYQEA